MGQNFDTRSKSSASFSKKFLSSRLVIATMETPTLDNLPTEIKITIIDLLGPKEVQSLYSTSRLWRSVSDAQYSELFFSTQSVHIERESLDRLDAVSRDRICRRRVRAVTVIPSQRKRSSISRSAEWPPTIAVSVETESLLASRTAANQIAAAVRRFHNCRALSVRGDVRELPQQNSTRNANIPPHDPVSLLRTHLRGNTAQQRSELLNFMSHFYLNVLAVIENCERIESLEYFTNGSNTLTFIPKEQLCDLPSPFMKSPHLWSLSIKLSIGPLLVKPGMNRLRSLLKLFPNLQTFTFKSQYILGDIPPEDFFLRLVQSLPKRLKELQLRNMSITDAAFTTLINECNATKLERLTLSSCWLRGTTQAWRRAITGIGNVRDMRTLVLEGCLGPQLGAHMPSFDPESKLIYRRVGKTAHNDATKASTKWVVERQEADTNEMQEVLHLIQAFCEQ